MTDEQSRAPLFTRFSEFLGSTGDSRVVDLPPGAGPELQVWAGADRTRVEVAGWTLLTPTVPSLSEAIATKDCHTVARLRSLFCGLGFLAEEGEAALLAGWVPLASGSSPTFYTHQDEWRLEKDAFSIGRAITSRVTGCDRDLLKAFQDLNKVARKEKHPAWLDPRGLWKATDWIVDLFLTISADDTTTQLGRALPYKLWGGAQADLSRWPHVAAYWLLAHWAFGNDEDLEIALDALGASQPPFVRELRALVTGGDFPDADRLRASREGLVAMAPARVLSKAARRRKKAVEKALLAEPPEVVAAWETIRAEGGEALTQFSALEELSGDDRYHMPTSWEVEAAVDGFVDAVTPVWWPVLLHRQRIAARFPDSHRYAIPGLLRAIAPLAPDFGVFSEVVLELGTRSFEHHRNDELALAVERFIDDPRAREWLFERAAESVEILHSDAPLHHLGGPFEVLCRHHIPETVAILIQAMNTEPIESRNQLRELKKAVVAAAELGAVECLPAARDMFRRLESSPKRNYLQWGVSRKEWTSPSGAFYKGLTAPKDVVREAIEKLEALAH